VQQASAYNYVNQARKNIRTLKNDETVYRAGLMLKRLDDFYTVAYKQGNFSVCLGVLRNEIEVLGLKKIKLILEQTIKQNIKVSDGISTEDRASEVFEILLRAGAIRPNGNKPSEN